MSETRDRGESSPPAQRGASAGASDVAGGAVANAEPARRCPICAGACPPRGHGDAYPFCSRRCQLVDLSRWLDEDYRIPDLDA
jgi:endogenous inhibitor of DNA gyrase (YacG/DUF329 family)